MEGAFLLTAGSRQLGAFIPGSTVSPGLGHSFALRPVFFSIESNFFHCDKIYT